MDRDLCKFASDGNIQKVRHLLDKGANINFKSELLSGQREQRRGSGSPPLLWAASKGHAHVVEELLHRGADVETRNRLGSTALLCAAVGGHWHVVKLLMEHGGNPRVENLRGISPMTIARSAGRKDMADLIMAYKT